MDPPSSGGGCPSPADYDLGTWRNKKWRHFPFLHF
jgi:hypothetical protein